MQIQPDGQSDAMEQPASRAGREEPSWSTRALRRRRLRRPLPPMSVFPTMCTLGNLIAGFAAIHFAAKPLGASGIWHWSGLTVAAVLVFIGMVFDAVDGSIARLTHSTSAIGSQLDSLADMVTFGIAPAFMTTMLVSHYLGGAGEVQIIGPAADHMYGRFVWALAAAYVCCAALRLARFNVATPTAAAEGHLTFHGLPSPGAAGAVAGVILLHQYFEHVRFVEDVPSRFVQGAALGIPFIMALCAFAMISSLPYTHIINRYVRGRRSFRAVAWLVLPLIIVFWFFPQLTIALAFSAYALSAPVQRLRERVFGVSVRR